MSEDDSMMRMMRPDWIGDGYTEDGKHKDLELVLWELIHNDHYISPATARQALETAEGGQVNFRGHWRNISRIDLYRQVWSGNGHGNPFHGALVGDDHFVCIDSMTDG